MRATILSMLCCLLLCSACRQKGAESVPFPARSVYYWRTTFKLDSQEQKFINEQKIKKIYTRFFDVNINKQNIPVPISPIQFESNVPSGVTIIPVVYIEKECLHQSQGLAQHIVKMVFDIAENNHIKINELQIDCDWTRSTQPAFFKLLTAIRHELKSHSGFLLSATIRMHQLSSEVPPVDYGVLMCYNTGNLRDYDTENAILSSKAIQPYLRYLASYRLPLCAAYPIFEWKLLFEDHQFRAIIRDEEPLDSLHYRHERNNIYRVVRTYSVASPDPTSFGLMVRAGDEVKMNTVPVDTILSIKKTLNKRRSAINSQVILYSLNSLSTKKITLNEINQIYSH